MAKKESPYVCDVCGAEKMKTNHWFVIDVSVVGLHVHSWSWAVREGTLDSEGRRHVCGSECAHRLLGDFLGSVAAN